MRNKMKTPTLGLRCLIQKLNRLYLLYITTILTLSLTALLTLGYKRPKLMHVVAFSFPHNHNFLLCETSRDFFQPGYADERKNTQKWKKMEASLLFTGCLLDAVYFPAVVSVPSTIVQGGHKDGPSAARSVGLWVRIPPVGMGICRMWVLRVVR